MPSSCSTASAIVCLRTEASSASPETVMPRRHEREHVRVGGPDVAEARLLQCRLDVLRVLLVDQAQQEADQRAGGEGRFHQIDSLLTTCYSCQVPVDSTQTEPAMTPQTISFGQTLAFAERTLSAGCDSISPSAGRRPRPGTPSS